MTTALRRVAIILFAAGLVTALEVSPSHAQYYGDAPWCAVLSVGTGEVVWYCYYRTVEDCVPNILAGNRGFCNVNPYGSTSPAPAAKFHAKHHKRYNQ